VRGFPMLSTGAMFLANVSTQTEAWFPISKENSRVCCHGAGGLKGERLDWAPWYAAGELYRAIAADVGVPVMTVHGWCTKKQSKTENRTGQNETRTPERSTYRRTPRPPPPRSARRSGMSSPMHSRRDCNGVLLSHTISIWCMHARASRSRSGSVPEVAKR
jgi:hypothetical protein